MKPKLIAFDAANSLRLYAEDKGKTEWLKNLVGDRLWAFLTNHPTNLPLDTLFAIGRDLGLSAAVVFHEFPESGEPSSSKTVLSQIFLKCWELCGKPTVMDDLEGDDGLYKKALKFAQWAADGCTCEHDKDDGIPTPCVPCQARAFIAEDMKRLKKEMEDAADNYSP